MFGIIFIGTCVRVFGGMTVEMTLETFGSLLQTEDDCIQTLFRIKWPDGFRCPSCSHSSCSVISTRRLPLYECLNCRAQTSIISDTIFRGSRTPIRSWLIAIYLHSRPNGINALQLSQVIRVTYKTAWLICHKLRFAMSQTDAETLLHGIVRVSDAIMYRRIIPAGNWRDLEQPVIAGSMEDENGDPTHVKIRVAPRSLRKDLYSSPDTSDFVKDVVAPESRINAIVTTRLGKNRNKELIWLCKAAERWIAWTFRGIGTKHLQVYLDHFCYIDNRNHLSIYDELLRDCVRRRGIDYPTLIGSRERSTRPSRQKHILYPTMAV